MDKSAARVPLVRLLFVLVAGVVSNAFKLNDPSIPKAEIPTLGRMIGTKHVTGTAGSPYVAFRGVPYAHPPVGSYRFKVIASAQQKLQIVDDFIY